MSGLDQLKQASNKRKGGGRPMPPPRHKPRQDQVEIPTSDTTNKAEERVAPAEPPARSAPAPTAAATPSPAPAAPEEPAPTATAATAATAAPAVASTPPEARPPRKVGPTTMYFDAETDDWLEDVLAIGRRGTPKVSSKSAIARLAIRELAKKMSAEQVVDEIRRGAAAANPQPGRPKL